MNAVNSLNITLTNFHLNNNHNTYAMSTEQYKVTFTEEVTYQVIFTFDADPEDDEVDEVSTEFFENGHYNDDNIIDVASSAIEIEKITKKPPYKYISL